MEATHERYVLFAHRRRLPFVMLAGLLPAACVLVLGHRPGSPAGTVSRATKAWPSLAVPPGDGGLRVQLTQSQGLVTLNSTTDAPQPMQGRPFRLISQPAGRVWRLRTDRRGRAQLAVPPGRYQLRLDWTNTGGPRWQLHVRAGETLAKHLEEYVG